MKSVFLLLIVCLSLGAIVSHVVPDDQVCVEYFSGVYRFNLLILSPFSQPKPAHIETPAALCPLQCRLRGVYNVPSFHSCYRFYRCVQGIAVELDCPGYLVFDHVTLQCRMYDEARCLFEGPVVPELEWFMSCIRIKCRKKWFYCSSDKKTLPALKRA